MHDACVSWHNFKPWSLKARLRFGMQRFVGPKDECVTFYFASPLGMILRIPYLLSDYRRCAIETTRYSRTLKGALGVGKRTVDLVRYAWYLHYNCVVRDTRSGHDMERVAEYDRQPRENRTCKSWSTFRAAAVCQFWTAWA